VNTGAGYPLYGCCRDCVKGASGDSREVAKIFVAIDGQGRPAFEGQLHVTLAIGDALNPPTVTGTMLASR
jgi:hypothetical protein